MICATNTLTLILFAKSSPIILTTNDNNKNKTKYPIFLKTCSQYLYPFSNSKFCHLTSSGFGALFI